MKIKPAHLILLVLCACVRHPVHGGCRRAWKIAADHPAGRRAAATATLQLAALGFDWRVNQAALVNTLFNNASGAGLLTTGQVQALHMDVPLIQKNPVTGEFTFTFGLQKSATLAPGSFVPLPFTPAGTSVNRAGKVQFRFFPPDNAAFFRVEPP